MFHPAKLPRTLFPIAAAVVAGLSALAPSAFSQSKLLITEIHYHPDATGPAENQEFIEIKNVGDEAQSLIGYSFGGVGNVTFLNPQSNTIQPGGFLVIAKSSAAFNAKYQFLPGATFDGSLRNSGEKLDIVTPLAQGEETVFSVDYWDGNDEDPLDPDDDNRPLWPSSPDGDGYSLVPQNPNVNTDPDDYRNWRPSIDLGGSPGPMSHYLTR